MYSHDVVLIFALAGFMVSVGYISFMMGVRHERYRRMLEQLEIHRRLYQDLQKKVDIKVVTNDIRD